MLIRTQIESASTAYYSIPSHDVALKDGSKHPL
ncbi:MAG: hypothetical protein ACI9NT_000978, partial [Bacteroidia bacterium]